jgi:DNA invertase Pin-like site-specific DNA recombinase
MSRVIAYLRCSTQEQAEAGLSLVAQRARIDAWCSATGAELIEVVEDMGVSGTRPISAREGGSQIAAGGSQIAAVLQGRSPKVDAIVVVRLDRLGRDAAETLQLLKRFASGSVGLVSITDRLDLSTPQGRAMAGVSAVFAELERALIGQRTAEALDRLRSQGRAYGPVPYGFDRHDDLLVRNEAEQATLVLMRDMRDAGHSFAVIASRLNEQSTPSKRGGIWHAMSVRSVLRTIEKIEGLVEPTPSLVTQPS